MQGLDDTSITTEAKNSINFTESPEIFILSLIIMEETVFLFVNATKIYQFKAKDSEVKPYLMCLENILKDFTANNMSRNGLNGYVYHFSVVYNIIGTSCIINIHKYLMKKHDIK